MRFTFEPTFADGTPRRYVGLYRPTYEMAAADDRMKGYRSSGPSFFDEWYKGHFDRPLYVVEDGERDDYGS